MSTLAIRLISVSIMLFCVPVYAAPDLQAAEKQSPVTVENGLVTIDPREIGLSVLLQEMSEILGVELFLTGAPGNETVRMNIRNMTVEETVRRVLKGYDYAVVYPGPHQPSGDGVVRMIGHGSRSQNGVMTGNASEAGIDSGKARGKDSDEAGLLQKLNLERKEDLEAKWEMLTVFLVNHEFSDQPEDEAQVLSMNQELAFCEEQLQQLEDTSVDQAPELSDRQNDSRNEVSDHAYPYASDREEDLQNKISMLNRLLGETFNAYNDEAHVLSLKQELEFAEMQLSSLNGNI